MIEERKANIAKGERESFMLCLPNDICLDPPLDVFPKKFYSTGDMLPSDRELYYEFFNERDNLIHYLYPPKGQESPANPKTMADLSAFLS